MPGRNTWIRLCCHRGWRGQTGQGQVLAQQSDTHELHTHPAPSTHPWRAARDAGTGRAGREQGQWALELPCVTEGALGPHGPGQKGKRSCTLPPGQGHHHKVLMWETGQAMQTSQPLCHSPSAVRGRGSRAGGERPQSHKRPGTGKGAHTTQPTGTQDTTPPNQGLVLPLPQGRQQGFIDPKHQGQPWEFCYSAI